MQVFSKETHFFKRLHPLWNPKNPFRSCTLATTTTFVWCLQVFRTSKTIGVNATPPENWNVFACSMKSLASLIRWVFKARVWKKLEVYHKKPTPSNTNFFPFLATFKTQIQLHWENQNCCVHVHGGRRPNRSRFWWSCKLEMLCNKSEGVWEINVCLEKYGNLKAILYYGTKTGLKRVFTVGKYGNFYDFFTLSDQNKFKTIKRPRKFLCSSIFTLLFRANETPRLWPSLRWPWTPFWSFWTRTLFRTFNWELVCYFRE